MKVQELSAFLIICFSSYFMTSVMPISPIYFTTLIALLLVIEFKKLYGLSAQKIFIYSVHFIYAIYFLLNSLINDTKLHDACVMLFFGLYYIFCDIILFQLKSKREISFLLKSYFWVFTLYYIFDLYFRWQTSKTLDIPGWMRASPWLQFYLYKQGGLLGDSNSMGVFVVCMCSVFFYAAIRKILSKKYVFIIILYSVFTCSRTSIFAIVLSLLFYKFYYKQNLYIKVFSMMGFLILLTYFSPIFLEDGSFLTKIDIFQKTFDHLKECNLFNFFCGTGANTSIVVLKIYAHNIWSLQLVEYGIIGCLLFSSMLLFTCADCGKNSFIVLIPYLIVSLSFTPIFLPFLMTAFALNKHINRILKE